MTRLHRLWVLASQAVNAFAFEGDPDESLSARCWRMRHLHPWGERYQSIDGVLGAGHCQQAHEQHLARHQARNQ